MGFWFGKSSSTSSWRKTPTKIGKQWYTPSGETVRNSKSYFGTIQKNGEYWKGNTGWKNKGGNICYPTKGYRSSNSGYLEATSTIP